MHGPSHGYLHADVDLPGNINLQDENDNISMNRNSSVSTTLSKAFMNLYEKCGDFTENDIKTHAFQKTYDKQRNELERLKMENISLASLKVEGELAVMYV